METTEQSLQLLGICLFIYWIACGVWRYFQWKDSVKENKHGNARKES